MVETIRTLFLSTIFSFFIGTSTAQLINLPQTFSPKASVSHDYSNYQSTKTNTSAVNLAFTLKTKLGVKLNFHQKNRGIEGIEDVLKVQFSQKLIGVSIRNTEFETPYISQTQKRIGISLTSINYQKKLRFLLYRFGSNYYYTPNTSNTAFSANGLIAQMQIINLRNILFYGAIGVWNYGNNILLPIIGWMHKIDKQMSYTFIFPSSAKFTYRINKSLKLDATTYINTLRNQVIENSTHYSSQLSQLRSGAQLHWHIGKSSVLNLETGIEYYSRLNNWHNFEKQTPITLPSKPFLKASFFYTFGKSLFNSDVLNINLE